MKQGEHIRSTAVFHIIVGLLIAPALLSAQVDHQVQILPNASGFLRTQETVRASSAEVQSGYHPGRIIVKFKDGMRLPDSEFRSFKQLSRQSPVYSVENLPGMTSASTVQYYRSLPQVDYAEPDYVIHIDDTVPDDPLFSQQWSLAHIQSPAAWDMHTDSSGTVVGVMDTGVDFTHPDLQGNLWTSSNNPAVHGYTCLNGVVSEGGEDDNGHGTHVSGIIAAATNNGVGIAGINWNAQIISLKFTNAAGEAYTSDAVDCINKAIELKQAGVNLRVINNSWGFSWKTQALEDAFHALDAADILSVASAGNDGGQNIDLVPHYPAAFQDRGIISAMATDVNDVAASFSAYGRASVDIAAPGVTILSTVPTGFCDSCSPSGYANLSGTSMSAPHVTGVAAALFSMNPALTAHETRDILLDQNSYDPVPQSNNRAWETTTGGVLNHQKAITNPLVFAPTLNNFPTLSVTPNISRATGTQVQLVATVSDDDGDPLWSTWRLHPEDVPGLIANTLGISGFGYEALQQPMSFLAPSVARIITAPYVATVRDSNGGSAMTEAYVNVLPNPLHGQPPSGTLMATPDAQNPDLVRFQHHGVDPEGQPVRWDFTVSTGTPGSSTIYYVCCMSEQSWIDVIFGPGSYRTNAQSIDPEMNIGANQTMVLHIEGDTEVPPVAAAVLDQQEGVVPFTAHYDASTSYDPDGSISHYFVSCGKDEPYVEGPTGSCTYNTPGPVVIHVLVKDDHDNADHINLNAMAIAFVCPVITPDDTLPDGFIGSAYNGAVHASGGTAPYNYQQTAGSLPPGIVLDQDGTLSGTPSSTGLFSFSITATDSAGCTGTRTYGIIIQCHTIALDDTLPDGVKGASYQGTVSASGGTGPYTYVRVGSLPPGLSLSSDGTLTGTPTATGVFNFSIRATDALGCWGVRLYQLVIVCPAILMDDTLQDSTKFANYRGVIVTTGGTEPYVYAVTAGALPVGIALNSDGTLSGTANAVGTFNFTVMATDAGGCAGSRNYAVTVGCPAVSLDDTLPDGTRDDTYTGAITPSGGTAPYSFVLNSGMLPTGVVMDSGGFLFGAPTQVGVFTFDVMATDADGCTGERGYDIGVTAPPCIFCDDFEDGDYSNPPWTVKNGAWLVVSGRLTGSTTGVGEIHSPSFAACTECTIETNASLAAMTRLSIVSWFSNSKENVEIRLMQEKQKILIRQKHRGDSAKSALRLPVLPNHTYNLRSVFDGTTFHVFLDGIPVLSLNAVATPAGGSLQIRVKAASGSGAAVVTIEDIKIY